MQWFPPDVIRLALQAAPSGGENGILLMMGAAISALFGALMLIVRMFIQRLERLLEAREAERSGGLAVINTTVGAIQTAIIALSDTVNAVSDVIKENQRENAAAIRDLAGKVERLVGIVENALRSRGPSS